MAQSEVASDKDIVMCRTAAFVGIDIFCGSGESIVEDKVPKTPRAKEKAKKTNSGTGN
ncbi:predicted protein [Botrytis cinerea T4]|uniref:Uncharacterized protein n=1 Tax=Botryotinia fuckeliana (strain T4) TaxID=999810 RepID=G2Y2V1_BOTF4|nr:predicted protein [Botrytis cinerea T4]